MNTLFPAARLSMPIFPNCWLALTTDDSGAQTIARLLPGARVVEAFNTVFAAVFESGDTRFGERRATVFFCGDDAGAKQLVSRLIEDGGCDGVDAGPLSSALS